MFDPYEEPEQPYSIARARARVFAIVSCVLLALAGLSPARAATFTWDPSEHGTGSDGSGTWSNISPAVWANGGSDYGWSNGDVNDNAVIGDGGTAGTITVSGGVSVGNITFNPVTSGTYYTIGGSTITLTSGTIADNSASAVINSVLAGSVGLTTSGTGTLTLGGANTYSGSTVLTSGTLTVTNNSAFSTSTVYLDGATLYGAGITLSNAFVAQAGSTSYIEGGSGASNLTISGNITGSGNLVTNNNGGNIRLNGNDSGFNGTFTANNFLYLPSVNAGSASAAWVVNSDVIPNGGSGTYNFGSLSGNGSGNIQAQSGSDLLSIGALNQSTVYSGVISQSGATASVAVVGGTLTLAGASTYTGSTTINGGVLQIGNGTAGSINSTSGITVSSGTVAFDEANSSTISQGITDTGAVVGAEGNGVTNTLSGNISGSGGVFTQSGAGTTILSGSNSYTGATSINAGVLNLSNTNALAGGGAVTFGGGTLEYSSSNTVDYSGQIAGSGSAISVNTNGQNVTFASALASSNTGGLTKLGTGTLTLTASNAYTGATTVSAGTLEFANESSLYNYNTANWTGANIIVQSGATLALQVGVAPQFTASDLSTLLGITSSGSSGFETGSILGLDTTSASGGSFTYSGVIANGYNGSTLGLTKLGAGTLTLTASNTFTGGMTITAGTLQLGDGVSNNGYVNGNITDNGTLAFADPSAQTYSGVISGSGGVIKSGAGTLTLGVANSYSGGTTLSSGTLSLSNIGALGSGTLTLSGGTLFEQLGTYIPNNVFVTASTTTTILGGGGGSWGGVSGSIAGSGTIQSSTGGDNIRFDGNDSGFSGTFIVQNASVYLNSGSSASAAAAWQIGAGGLVPNASGTFNFGSLSGNGGIQGQLSGSEVLSIGALGQSTVYGGAISQAGPTVSMVVVGGTLTLTGASTYTGLTTINSGATVQIGNGGTTGSLLSTGTISDNGNLVYDYNNGTSVTIPSGSQLTGSGNLSATAGTINLSGTVALGGSQTYTEASGGHGISVAASGTTTLSGSSITLVGDLGNGTGTGTLAMNTSASNGPISLNISLGRSGVFDPITGVIANSGTGAISVIGTGPASSGWSGTPVTLTGAVNISAPVNDTSTLTINPTAASSVSGALSGGMFLVVGGPGALTIVSSNSYTGATTVTAGSLIVSGSLSGTASVSATAGATLEVDGLVNHSATVTVNGGTLDGTGSVGAINANGGSIAPGLTMANATTAPGTLTAAGAVTLSSTTNFDIRLGTATGSDFDQLAVTSGAVSLNGANLVLTLNAALNNPANIGDFYTILTSTASVVGEFAQGTSFTTNGYSFDVLYNVGYGDSGSGDDVVLQLTAIPEPGTWATLLAGLGLLCAYQRRRGRQPYGK